MLAKGILAMDHFVAGLTNLGLAVSIFSSL
jgi:hypothetical protein